MSIDSYVSDLQAKSGQVITSTLADEQCKAGLASARQIMSDLATCAELITNKHGRAMLDASIREFEFAIFCICHGAYRHAFFALRLALELWLAAVQFSTNEKEIRKWHLGRQDIVWAKIINEEAGVFSKDFVSAFFPKLSDKSANYRRLGEKVYRECSEYVHGNANTHGVLPDSLQFSKKILLDWISKTDSVLLISLFAFFVRYADSIDFSNNKFAVVMQERLGHLPEIRDHFGGS